MTHLSLVPPSPAPTMPEAVAPPVRRGFAHSSSEFYSHGLRLAPSRLYPDRVAAPPGGRAHVTEDPSDLDLEKAVLRAMEVLARGRELKDELGQPISPFEKERFGGMHAAVLAGIQARLRPHLRRDHPWSAQAAELVDKLAVEERHWWTVSGRRM